MVSLYAVDRSVIAEGNRTGKLLVSPRYQARAHFISQGLKFTVGSLEETLAIQRYERSQKIEFLKVLAINSAIFRAAEVIAASLSESGSAPSMEKHNDLLNKLQRELLPWIVDTDKEDKLEKARKVMEEQAALGPLTVTSMEKPRRGNKAGLY